MSFGEVAWGISASADQLPNDARFTAQSPALPRPPRLRHYEVARRLSQLSYDDMKTCLQSRLLPMPDGTYAACGRVGRMRAGQLGLPVLAVVDPSDLVNAAQQVWGKALCAEATSKLHTDHPRLSARRPVSASQLVLASTLSLAVLLGLISGHSAIIFYLAQFFGALLFLAVVAVRLLVLLNGTARFNPPSGTLSEDQLPVYTVLVPLFREVAVLNQIISGLSALDYPRDRLDIKILVEEGDLPMRAALAEYEWPQHFEILVVPAGAPQTKPRALSYGLLFARGELITIYDAEDIPAPSQLLRCAHVFATSPRQLACVQARLTVYNANENWITRQFALEYATLFGEILPALASLGLPLPLGGTSNHFRSSCLRHLGGWDPYNVTEDADLGMRLARLGYESATIDSDTFEEACVTYRDWHRQRARWLKGFLQTWLVHMRSPILTLQQLGWQGFSILQVMTLGVVASALLHPFLLAAAIWHFSVTSQIQNGLLQPATWVEGTSLMILVAGYGVSIGVAIRTLSRQGLSGLWSSLLTLPLYWLLLTPAALLALWQFATDLYGWNKTPHGKSRLRSS